jgi:tetraacyldisaccharide 4'-kinase
VGALLSRLARVYGWEVARRNARFDRGEGVVTLDRPVLSVGNLSVGGTGKTPMVRRVVDVLRAAGHRPCIAMRGYGASRRADGMSDEAAEYASALPGVPIVAQPDRTAGLLDLFSQDRGEAVDAVVLDDGFQHRRLARQLDLVLLDATRGPFEDSLLPLGRLREPADSLGRAHAAIATHAEAAEPGEVERMLGLASRAAPGLVVAAAEHAWDGLDLPLAGDGVDLGWLSGKRVLPVCAIGNPGAFVREVRRRAGSVLDPLTLRDHDPYRGATVRRIIAGASGAEAIVTTRKDWVKLARVDPSAWPCPVVVPRLEFRFVHGGDAINALLVQAAAAPPDTLA